MALVLVVDDEFAVAELLQAIIEDEGHEVATAYQGRAGLDSARARRPQLIFTDTMMPVMCGPEMVRAIVDDPRLAQTHVVAMSSHPEATVGPDYPSYTAFLQKPFRVTDVTNILTRLLPRG